MYHELFIRFRKAFQLPGGTLVDATYMSGDEVNNLSYCRMEVMEVMAVRECDNIVEGEVES